MPGWDDASVDELLADPIVRELMAADGVDLGELRTLLHEVQRTIERYATKRGDPALWLVLRSFTARCQGPRQDRRQHRRLVRIQPSRRSPGPIAINPMLGKPEQIFRTVQDCR